MQFRSHVVEMDAQDMQTAIVLLVRFSTDT